MSHNERTFCVLRSALCALLCCLLVTLAACAGPRAGVPAAQPTVVGVVQAATPAPQRTAAPVDERQWRVLYRRAGWDGGAAVDLRAVGDIMLGRLVADIAARRGYGYPFEQARPLLNGDPSPGSGQALAIGNLESPLTERRAPLRAGPYRLPAPTAFAAPLAGAGFRALSLANNHALDAGPAGLQDAAGALAAAGVAPLGAGPDAETARKPLIVDSNGLRVALLAFNAVADPEDQPGEGRGWGRAWLDDAALAAVGQARTDAGVVVVLVHWGREYAAQPSDLQRAWARRLVAAGADLVVGAHPHVLQPIETIAEGGRSGVVAYSLGNFVFDQEFSPATGTGAALRFMLDRQGVALAAAAPFEIVAGQPRPLALDGDAGQAVIESLACHRDYRDREHDPKPLCDLCALCGSKANEIAAWRWDGQTATAVDVPAGTVLGARPERLPADLRGDGRQLWAALDASGMVELRDGAAADAPVVWRNEEAGWRVSRIAAGDPNDDGRIELLLLLWKPDASGVPRAHPFLVGWRGGSYRVIWGGSAPSVPIQDIAIGDLDGDGRDELVVLEGGRQRGDAAEHVAIWRWHGWSFQREWRSPAGRWAGLALQDIDGDGRVEVVAGGAGNGL